jgi:hypothetical protein
MSAEALAKVDGGPVLVLAVKAWQLCLFFQPCIKLYAVQSDMENV